MITLNCPGLTGVQNTRRMSPATKQSCTPAYPPELCERGVRLFRDHHGDYANDNAAYRAIAPKLGCLPDRLRVWRQLAERDAGQRGGLTSAKKGWVKELERGGLRPFGACLFLTCGQLRIAVPH